MRLSRPLTWLAAIVAVASLVLPRAHAAAGDARPPDPLGCYEPVPDIDPADDPAGWIERDLGNVACGYMRQYDEVTNPAFLRTWAARNGDAFGLFPEQISESLREPMRPRDRTHAPAVREGRGSVPRGRRLGGGRTWPGEAVPVHVQDGGQAVRAALRTQPHAGARTAPRRGLLPGILLVQRGEHLRRGGTRRGRLPRD